MFHATANGMTASVLTHGDGATVTARGRIDVDTAPILEGVFLGLWNCEMNDVVLDLAHLTFMDSFGLGSIMHAVRAHPGASLRVINPSFQVRSLLELTGTDSVLSLG